MKDCKCNCVDNIINNPDTHGLYSENIKKLNQWEEDGILELYAGDSYLDKVIEHARSEDRGSISHYYRCKTCGEIFFIGFYCRGGYNFRVDKYPKDYAKTIDDIDFEYIMSGNEQIGTRFKNSKRFSY